MKALVITEKPSVAMSISKILGATNKRDGYYEGRDYIVSWCIGHLIQLANPSSYDEKYAKWKLEDLPIIPSKYKYEVSKATKKQFAVLKKLMNDKDTDIVINACDAGREGELIFRLVYEQAKCKKKVKRLWISSMEDVAIREGFEHLKESEEYDALYYSALARSKADWLVGMNMSRLYSLIYNQNYSVGRVQTPTLAMMVQRDADIKNFKKETYYTLEIATEGFILTTDRIDDLSEVKEIKENLPNILTIKDVSEEEKITKPDKLYDLTTLQRECNKYFGYSAKQTLDYAQSLYEKKLITYPRTDSRYLNKEMRPTVEEYIRQHYFEIGPPEHYIVNMDNFNKIFDSGKVSDHHAIIPTLSSEDYRITDLPKSEKEVFLLIRAKLLAANDNDKIEKITKITADVGGIEFTAKGKVLVTNGFMQNFGNIKQERKEVILPDVKRGQTLEIMDATINEKYTMPPKPYTEDTLLKAMETAGNDSLDKDVEVERKGLGTPATRAGIIETLIAKEMIRREKKNLIPTEKGIGLIKVVTDFLTSPKTTAIWEMKLSDIANGRYEQRDFLKEIETKLKHIIQEGRYDV